MADVMGYFLGNAFMGSFAQPAESIYCFLDIIFIFIIIVSFYLYYKMYQYIKKKFPEPMVSGFSHILVALSLVNLIFIGILIEFVYFRKYLDVQFPLSTRLAWLVIAIAALYMMAKAYSVVVTGHIRTKGGKRVRKSLF
jgi:hypothetical protein